MIVPALVFSEKNSLEVLAPAKINLALDVRGKRPDGYHDIRSILVPVSLFDRLTVHRTDGAVQVCVLPSSTIAEHQLDLASPDDNLATRAVRLLQRHTGSRHGAVVEIEKHIPAGGGLGGGSSDAAAVLRACNTLWGAGLGASELAALGAELGSDVPAQVLNRATEVSGRGERVAPLTLARLDPARADWWLVVMNPGFPVSTRDVYERYTPSLTSRAADYTNIVFAVQERSLFRVAGLLFNDLQATVVQKYPLIAMLLESLTAQGALGNLLSGSGGSVFGLARDEGHAHAMLAAVRAALGAGLWGRVVRMLPDGVMAAHGPLEARV